VCYAILKHGKMKYLKLLILFLTFISVNDIRAQDLICSINHKHDGVQENNELTKNSQTVYVCIGSYAYAYHSRSDCPGLGNCKGDINYTDENYATGTLGRVPCCRCWSNVTERCKDDNPYYGGSGGSGDNSEAYAYLAVAIVATSAIILSNDIYLYPAISFHNPTGNNNYYGQQSSNGIGSGWTFGFRKTFKHSALEYGASFITSKVHYRNGYSYTSEIDRWGGHLNFVHQIFYHKTPNWLKVYFGPSTNVVYDFGYGGMLGAEMKLFDRLRFDVRYELTTQTNQLQAGLIFTYQKKYFWQK
jgi:hypothetical protein